MDKFNIPLLVVLFCFTFSNVFAFPEKGKWTYDINQDTKFLGVFKSLFAHSSISFNIHDCKSDPSIPTPIQLVVSWSLRHSPCWQEYIGLENVETENGNLQSYFFTPDSRKEGLNYTSPVEYVRSEEMNFVCESQHPIIMPEIFSQMKKTRTGRAIVTGSPQYIVPKEGVYLFILQVKTKSISFTAQTTIEMKSDHGYLSAVDWPLLPFYATMCALYSIMGALWLIICLCRWRDILRIQMWIGAVLFLGMLEMAVYLAEYESLNKTGELTEAAEYTAELLSCAKRSLARILVLIASMGFGIVKPRLGTTLRKIVGAGIFYMVVSSIESYLKLVQPKNDGSRNIYAATLILALMDAALGFWIFSSLVATVRTLRLRRNTVKLALYNHFTNTLIFAVIASLVFMLWSIYFHQMATCLTDWKELWLDEAFWKLLFSLLLIVIMVLWRPTNNNQRYAFTPLLDSGDEEDEDDVVVHDNLVGMKMRVTRANADFSPKASGSIEDELKWVEEHIPSSVVEAGAPLLDSEEEVLTAHFELSKMQ